MNVLGVGVSLINMGIALDRINRWIAARDRQYVSVSRRIPSCRRNERLRQVVNAARWCPRWPATCGRTRP